MDKILYTVCSANHLAFAKTMADSFAKHHADYEIFICLTDKINNRFSESEFKPYHILEAGELGFEQLPDMSDRYTIIELNCALKPFVALYLFKKYNPKLLIYTDSDIFFYKNINCVEQDLKDSSILLTPHILSPYHDDLDPKERDMLRSGIYNAGFIAMKAGNAVTSFLEWWRNRMVDQCYYNFNLGMAVDQNWLNLVPLFFEEVKISFDKSLNVAYWNLHEREIKKLHELYFVNNAHPLTFFHYSGYKLSNPNHLSIHQTRIKLNDYPDLKTMVEDYHQMVLYNGYEKYFSMKCYYAKPPKKSMGILSAVNRLMGTFGLQLQKK